MMDFQMRSFDFAEGLGDPGGHGVPPLQIVGVGGAMRVSESVSKLVLLQV